RAERESIESSKSSINEQIDEVDDRITRMEEVVEKDNAAIDELNEAVELSKELIYNAMSEKAGLDARMQHYETLREQNQARKQELSQKLGRFKEESDAQKKQISELKAEKKRIADAMAELSSKSESLSKQREDLRAQSFELSSAYDAKKDEYNKLNTRLESLRNIAERYEGYGNSVKRVMEAREKFDGIIGVVADLIEVPSKYETAIETALGAAIQNIVTKNEATAKKAIEYLKTNKFGRATFLPLTGINVKGEFTKPQALDEKGVVGLADSLVSVKGDYSGLVKHLLGRIVVVDEIDNAIAISKKYQQSLKLVTLEGELFNPGGAISGGAYKNSSNLLGRKRELEELEGAKKAAKEELTRLEVSRDENRKLTEKVKGELAENSSLLQSLRINESRVQVQSSAAEQRSRELMEQQADISKETQLIKEQLVTIEQSKGDLKDSTKLVDVKSKDAEKELKKLEKKLETATEKRDEHQLALENLKLEFANLSQKDSFIMENMERVDKETEKLESEAAEIKAGIDSSNKAIEEKNEHIVSLNKRIADAKASIDGLSLQVESLTKQRDEKSVEKNKYFDKREEISTQINTLEKDKLRLEAQLEKLTEQLDRYVEYLWNEYEMTPSEAEAFEPRLEASLTEIKKKTNELKQAIKALGAVNVNAIEDFKEVSERYFFMKTQHEDLIKAQESLLGIIAELDEGMRKQFNEKFADIQKEFDKVFKELFGGGQGSLELVEGEDVLEAGIQIIAQPPGKKLQNMMQLSGGEKALTAICLLFAIQNLKPSPFCLLDEIEAALDDSNVTRYAEYLAKLKANTQFIVITHRRGTMIIADRLYGITMQEKGVSTLVSVDLTDEKFLQDNDEKK
ncbi:MAG: chromosome segregation protein SMC, partial [Lachnospiraceae bacterium]|nr:chromosome segregation protein SMC [Lachnospiraceae bacterium]